MKKLQNVRIFILFLFTLAVSVFIITLGVHRGFSNPTYFQKAVMDSGYFQSFSESLEVKGRKLFEDYYVPEEIYSDIWNKEQIYKDLDEYTAALLIHDVEAPDVSFLDKMIQRADTALSDYYIMAKPIEEETFNKRKSEILTVIRTDAESLIRLPLLKELPEFEKTVSKTCKWIYPFVLCIILLCLAVIFFIKSNISKQIRAIGISLVGSAAGSMGIWFLLRYTLRPEISVFGETGYYHLCVSLINKFVFQAQLISLLILVLGFLLLGVSYAIKSSGKELY
mgnify:CR=1 FL=1